MRSLAFSVLFLFGLSAQAAPVCFQDVREWESVRTQLPAVLQSDELYAIHQGQIKGGFSITQAGSRIHLEAHVKHPLGRVDESDNITSTCVDGTMITIVMEQSKKTRQIEIVDGGLKRQGQVFTITTREAYEEALRSIGR
jgi:hypothetical protein